jgi:hypothetical protein
LSHRDLVPLAAPVPTSLNGTTSLAPGRSCDNVVTGLMMFNEPTSLSLAKVPAENVADRTLTPSRPALCVPNIDHTAFVTDADNTAQRAEKSKRSLDDGRSCASLPALSCASAGVGHY